MLRLSQNKAQSMLASLVIIVLLGFFAYSFMVTDSFKTMDDKASIVNNDLIKDIANLKDAFKTSYFGDKSYWRPLVFVSYMIEYHLFGLNPFYYYLINLAFHLCSGILIFFLIKLFYEERWTPFFVSLLFTTHPVHWEAVSNIPGRAILLSAFFYFFSFYLFCLSRRKKGQAWILILSLIAFIGSLLSKESGIMLPVLILAYLWFFERRPGKLSYFSPSVPYFFILAGYLLVRRMLGMVSLFYTMTWENSFFGFFTFLRSILTHLRLFVLPYDLHFDRSRQLFTQFADPQLLLTATVFLCFIFLLWRWQKRFSPKMLFFLSWFFIDLFPVSQLIVSIGTQAGRISTAEHFLYSASVGIFVLIVVAGRWLYQKNDKRRILSASVVKFIYAGVYIFLYITTIQQNIYASSELAMLAQSLKYNPDNIRMVESYGYALVSAKKFEEGEKFFRKVLEHNPNHLRSRISLGKVLCDQGRCVEGLLEYEKVTDAGDLKELLEQNKKATYAVVIRQYEALLKNEPHNPQLLYSLGIVYAKTQRLQEGVAVFEEAVRLKPDFKEALFNLASTYDGLGEKEKAKIYYQRMLGVAGDQTPLNDYAQKRLAEIP